VNSARKNFFAVPLSPKSNTVALLAAAFSAVSMASAIFLLWPVISR